MTVESTERELTILCPWHGEEEQITLPGSYDTFFRGLIPCGDKTQADRHSFFISVEGKTITSLKLNAS